VLFRSLANERVRLAEAKAAKAIAAARAAAAGLTVSPADIAAIESGLVVPSYAAPKKTPWLAIAGAFIGGLAVMFAVAKLVLKDNPQTVAAAAQPTAAPPPAPQQVQQTQPTPPPKPTVTPIEEPAKADAAKSQVKVEPIDPTPAAEPAKTEPAKAEPPKVVKQEHKAAPTVHHATPAAKKPAGGGIVDPFASPAPAAKKAPEKKPGGLVDPF